jgi:hypothetical protein
VDLCERDHTPRWQQLPRAAWAVCAEAGEEERMSNFIGALIQLECSFSADTSKYIVEGQRAHRLEGGLFDEKDHSSVTRWCGHSAVGSIDGKVFKVFILNECEREGVDCGV